MARMNSTKRGIKADIRTTVNHEGAVVHDLNSLEVLFSKVLGSFFGESTFYEKRDADKDFIELVETINEVDYEDIEYVLKIALLGREYNMIQYPLAVLTACFNDERFKGEDFLGLDGRNKLQFYSNKIVRRGRDIVDVMSMQINAFGFDKVVDGKPLGNDCYTVSPKQFVEGKRYRRDLPLPIQLRKSLKHKLETFNDYQLSKALSENREVSLADCIKLLRPSEKRARVPRGFFADVIEGNVKVGAGNKQVQVELSKARNKNSDSTIEDIKKSIDSSTVMAIVKNLVALHRAGVLDDKQVVENIVSKLTDKDQIRRSRLLPFRFYSAWKEVNISSRGYGARRISDALVTALDLSIENLPVIEGYNAILIDRSGSMRSPVSSMSQVTAEEIALLLGAICFKQSVGEIYVFANQCVRVEGLSSRSTVIDLVRQLERHNVGGGTYIDGAFDTIRKDAVKTKYDNLIMLTDNDCYNQNDGGFVLDDTSYSFYRREQRTQSADDMLNNMISKGQVGKFYLNNLLGNKFAIVNTDDYRKNLITGFSERIVEAINMYGSLGRGASDIRVVIDSLMSNIEGKSLR